ncbi:MAG: GNAT family N-acetyltransferase [Gaiellaceae bacterium]
MKGEAARAWAFMRRGELRGLREEASPLGTAVRDERFALRHDSNYLFVERAASAEEIRGELVRLRLPIAVVPGDLEETGQDFVVMVHRGERLPPARPAEQAALEDVAPLRREGVLGQPWGNSDVADQLIAARAELATRISVTHFVARAGGQIVAWADLYADGDEAQIEDVATILEHRGQGYATGVVLTALAAAPQFCFLVADAGDWPRVWYARLGFEDVGRYSKVSAKP